jgi:hypothetical protein
MKANFWTIFWCLIAVLASSCDTETMGEILIVTERPIGWFQKDSCTVKLVNNKDTSSMRATVKLRGGMSRKYFKQSYVLELNEKKKMLGLAHDDDWILNASYIDKTFMRHKLSYDLFREMRIKNESPKCSYTKLYVNDEYKGIFILMEKLTASRLGLNKAHSESMVFKDTFIFKDDLDFNKMDSAEVFHQKYPDWDTEPKNEELLNLRKFILESSDEEFALQCGNYIDLTNTIDWHLLLLLSNGGDGVIKNYYLYKKDAQTPFRIALWDCDHSFGRDGDGELNMLKTTPNFKRNILLNRLITTKEIGYENQLKTRWWELRNSGVFSENNLLSKIRSMQAMLEPYVEMNAEKWPLDGEFYYDSNSFLEEVEILKKFIKLNFERLDERFE